MSSSNVTESTHAVIKSKVNEFKTKLSFLVLEHITRYLPTSDIDVHQIALPMDITLADTSFHVPGKIDLLLGAGVFWTLLYVGQLRIPNSQLILQKTKLGWIVSGNIPFTDMKSEIAQSAVCGLATDQALESGRSKGSGKSKRVPHKKYSTEEQICEDEFKTTHRRDQDG